MEILFSFSSKYNYLYSYISYDVNGCIQSLNESKTLVVNELPVVDVSGTTEI